MSHFDLLRLRGETLQDGLNRPRLAFTHGLPQQGCDLLRTACVQEGGVKAFLELQAAAGDASRISGLAGLPAVLISGLESGSRIPGLSAFEFSVFAHSIWLHKPQSRCRHEPSRGARRLR